jgi:hypothetical protein
MLENEITKKNNIAKAKGISIKRIRIKSYKKFFLKGGGIVRKSFNSTNYLKQNK